MTFFEKYSNNQKFFQGLYIFEHNCMFWNNWVIKDFFGNQIVWNKWRDINISHQLLISRYAELHYTFHNLLHEVLLVVSGEMHQVHQQECLHHGEQALY